MRSILYCLIIMLGLASGCTTGSKTADADLVFMGTVETLESSPVAESRLNYVVQCRVDEILSGAFSGRTFSFRIHSPSRSGLKVGKQYKVRAKRTAEGFAVDQYQWVK